MKRFFSFVFILATSLSFSTFSAHAGVPGAGHFAQRARASAKLNCSSVRDIGGASNILYKNSNLHGGRGRSFLDQDHYFGGARRLQVAGKNGTIIGCFGLYACDRPFGCRYYQATCGDRTSNSSFANAARKNGGSSVNVGTGSGRCVSFNSTAARYGSVRK